MSAVPLSISHLPAGAPWWMFALAVAGLALHIGGGSIGILSGYTAVSVAKGEHLHRRAGTIFVAAMLVMALMGLTLAVNLQQRGNIAGGILAAYLVATGWMTVRRQEGRIGQFEKLACLAVLGTAAMMAIWGLEAVTSPTGSLDGYAPSLYFVFASFSFLFFLLDVKVIRQGGLSGTARISRHLWRMCAALFFAAASFFLGQQKVMPHWMHGSPVLWVLGLAPLGFMLFWLVRVRMKNARSRLLLASH